jgi:ubiquinol-cytochrome c reductase cytochrome c subunit
MPKRAPHSPRNRRPPAYDAEQIKALIRYMTPFTAGGPTIPDVNPAAGDLAQGGELYRANCASCHQWAGEGGALLGLIAPSLHQASAVQVGEAVRSGPVNMPAFSAQTINAHDLDSITAYVLSLRHPKDRGGAGLWHLGPFAEGLVAWVIGMGLLLAGIVWIGERE